MKLTIKKGTTSKLLRIFVTDSSKTDGSGLTGLVHNSASLTAYYIREGAAATTAITLVDAVVGTYTSSGFKEVDAANMPGIYELHPPNAVLASGADSVLIFLKGASNMAALPIEIQLDDNTSKDVYDRIGTPAGASIAADLVTIDNVVDVIEARLTAARAGYLDNLSAGAVALATGVQLSAQGKLDVNAECDTALTDYDAPTKAEMDTSFNALNNLSSANVTTACTSSLNAYDPPTKSEMDVSFNVVQTDLTNIEADTQDLQTQIGTAGVGLTNLGGMSTTMKGQINTEGDTALTDYDPPTKTGMDTSFNSVITEVDANETKIDTLMKHLPHLRDCFL